MSIVTAIAIYFVIWWIVLFAVLPWGIRSQHESGTVVQGSDPGAPAAPKLKQKLIWTTMVAALVFAGWYVVSTYRLIALDDITGFFGRVAR